MELVLCPNGGSFIRCNDYMERIMTMPRQDAESLTIQEVMSRVIAAALQICVVPVGYSLFARFATPNQG